MGQAGDRPLRRDARGEWLSDGGPFSTTDDIEAVLEARDDGLYAGEGTPPQKQKKGLDPFQTPGRRQVPGAWPKWRTRMGTEEAKGDLSRAERRSVECVKCPDAQQEAESVSRCAGLKKVTDGRLVARPWRTTSSAACAAEGEAGGGHGLRGRGGSRGVPGEAEIAPIATPDPAIRPLPRLVSPNGSRERSTPRAGSPSASFKEQRTKRKSHKLRSVRERHFPTQEAWETRSRSPFPILLNSLDRLDRHVPEFDGVRCGRRSRKKPEVRSLPGWAELAM